MLHHRNEDVEIDSPDKNWNKAGKAIKDKLWNMSPCWYRYPLERIVWMVVVMMVGKEKQRYN